MIIIKISTTVLLIACLSGCGHELIDKFSFSQCISCDGKLECLTTPPAQVLACPVPTSQVSTDVQPQRR